MSLNRYNKYKTKFCNDMLLELDEWVVEETTMKELDRIHELLDMIEDFNSL